MAPKFDDYATKMDTLKKEDSVWSKLNMLGKQVIIWKLIQPYQSKGTNECYQNMLII